MTPQAKPPAPLPALYTVYVLRSTVRRASLYIGSTPNPPRRLKQHNGDAKGGAARTSRDTLRPWEMIALVSGFPSMVAALKFEWALTNPHLSLHIPDEARIATSTQRKRNGMPKRPPHTLRSIMSNIHLLTGVPSFVKWPLNLHFMARDARSTWDEWLRSSDKSARGGLKIYEDFGPDVPSSKSAAAPPAHGIHALPLDYTPMIEYVAKAHGVVSFEQEGECVHCEQTLESGGGLHPMCPHAGCDAMGHLTCWGDGARRAADDERSVLPSACVCPSCGGEIRWGDMMKELSLRVRGQKEVEKLLKKKKRIDKVAASQSQA
ncbi:structure-specific endonuclease subunit SLX1 [Geosmithia morbida]|uniref:Structure-specific endonuclease subunit SLX1 n=1 Tax=Geosmithia morbida TaxID=1094350 RepID=A0A9P5D1Q7_9HYPO|nr:structure-specific endonuclease subunit SLX1 [Geosmithia morbida]KAF4120721.1 structure-specific endonuclease subunit SLX1 [Geosmithia morbida]